MWQGILCTVFGPLINKSEELSALFPLRWKKQYWELDVGLENVYKSLADCFNSIFVFSFPIIYAEKEIEYPLKNSW